jgi:geranylgeranyl pyrophosphate synthase
VQVLDIFRGKTAPAFEVALRLGALYAGDGGALERVFRDYCEALGIAYQVRDDLEDLAAGTTSDVEALRPSLPLALAYERAAAKPEWRPLLAAAWSRTLDPARLPDLRQALDVLQVEERGRGLLDGYKEQAVRALVDIDNASLKGLLRRVVGKIFNELEVKGWCSEFEARDAPGREARAQTAG